MSQQATAAAERAGWSVPSYCSAVGYSRAMYYLLPPELQPKSVKLGKRRIIIEPPADYLARLAATQEDLSTQAPHERA